MDFPRFRKFVVLFAGFIFLVNISCNAQLISLKQPELIHEITLFVIPSPYPIRWTSPSDLYKSMYLNYLKTLFAKHNYLLGHLAVRLNSPLLTDTILTGMASFSSKERTDLFFKEKIGLGVLGATLKGKLETKESLTRKLEIYQKRNKLAFITFRVNAAAIIRMKKFMDSYSVSVNQQPAACNYYGGSFWPLYAGEGAGCTAFGLALLEVANILPEASAEWLVRVNIPMSLVGGEFNNSKKVKFSTIRNTKSWANAEGQLNVDYIPFQIYDPSIIYDWIFCQRNCDRSVFTTVENNNVPGLYLDCSAVLMDENAAIFTERPKPDFFIDFFEKKLKSTVGGAVE